MKRGKKGQFYLIAAGIIIFIIVSMVAVSNSVYVKTQPQKFYDIGDVLGREGAKVIEFASFTNGDVNQNINNYLNLYKDYLDKNINTDFQLLIFYGSITDKKINVKTFSRSSTGDTSLCISGAQCISVPSSEVAIKSSQTDVIDGPDGKIVNVTITSSITGQVVSVIVPVLPDNNFVFVMSSNDEFNKYVQTNFPTRTGV
jgi:hypothetical protein